METTRKHQRTMSADEMQWKIECDRADAIPRNVALCSMCVEVAVAEVGDICGDCFKTWNPSMAREATR